MPGRELFSILKDTAGFGTSPSAHAVGDAVSGAVEVPVLGASDLAGNFQHIPVRAAGNADSTTKVPVLTALDNSGNLQAPDVKSAGQAPGTHSTPALVALDPSLNLAYLKVGASGELLVDTSGGTPTVGTPSSITGNPTNNDGTGGGFVTVATLTLTPSDTYTNCNFYAAATQTVLWQISQVNDMTTTLLAQVISGPGRFTVDISQLGLSVTAGAMGTQELLLEGKQIGGTADTLYGIVAAVQM